MIPPRLLGSSLICVLMVSGCQPESGTDSSLTCSDAVPSFSAVDSAGITVAINGAAERSISLVGQSPDVVYGAESGLAASATSTDKSATEPILFGSVTHARALPDGRVLVVDGKTVAARLFTSDGKFIGDIGRSGRGPGEFQRVSNVFVGAADTLWIFDGYGRRLLAFDATFKPVATVALPRREVLKPSNVAGAEPHRVSYPFVPVAHFSNGQWLLSTRAEDINREEVSSVSRDSARLVLWDRSSDTRTPLQLLPGTQRYEHFSSDGSITFGSVALGFTESFAAARDRYFMGTANSFSIDERSSDGSLVRIIRVCSPPEEVSARLADSLDDAAALLDEASWAAREAAARRIVPRPRPAPSYYEMLHDQSDRLWLREFTLPGAPHVWSVFDASGKRALQVTIPSHQTVLDAHESWILVRNLSEYDEATVHRYALP